MALLYHLVGGAPVENTAADKVPDKVQ
jgi:hypothetical protein